MANLRDPSELLGLHDTLTLVKLWHAFYGIFFWEFFTTLDFEWSIIRGHRPYRWTIWIYSLTRIATLVNIILSLIEFSISRPIDCHSFIIAQFSFAFFSIACASLLILLRVYAQFCTLMLGFVFRKEIRKADDGTSIAIWNYNKIVLALGTSVWGINIAFLIQGTVRLHSVWRPVAGLCEVPNSDITKLNVLATLATDVILLLMVLAGLLRLRLGGGGMFDLGSFLLKQGIIWLSLVVFAGILPAVFLILNINEQFNLMFQVPSLISVTISATRVYRSLIHFSSDTYGPLDMHLPTHVADSCCGVNSSGLPLSRISFAKVKVDSNVSRVIPLSPMDVVVHTTRHDDSFPRKTDSRSLDEQLGVEEHKLWSDEDVTSSKEKVISIVESPV
ncbi:hypothetical protein BGW80DRAFT_621328 [Lactifluus volemus]|nr:hypothetical protein BGW80DRAFT_621328 [Lactifluus volemus]